MVFQVLELIRRNLNTYFRDNGFTTPDPVILGNVAFAAPDQPGAGNDETAHVYISLVNVEEELSLKNSSAVRKSDIRPLAYVNPPLYINLYLLFSASHKDYNSAIQSLGLVLLFFQSNKVFSIARTPVEPTGVFATSGEDENRIQVSMDLMSLTFEQVNHLWGTLGGKQFPFLLFKARQVEIDADLMFKGGGVISEIQIN